MSSRKLESGLALAPNGMVLKGKPSDVMSMLKDLEETHGSEATLKEVYTKTMEAILHPVMPVAANIGDDND